MTSIRTNLQTPIPAPPVRQRSHPSTAGYWLALAIALIGLVAGLAWGLVAYQNYQGRIEDFPRLSDPGSATVRISAPEERVLFYEGSAAPTLAMLGITVTGPSGDAIGVAPYETDLRYDAPSGTIGKAVGTFAAPLAGEYRIVAGAVPSSDSNPVIAVGRDVPAGTVASVVGALFVIGTSLLIGAVLFVATAVRRSSFGR